MSYTGNTSAFQADERGPTPLTRSNLFVKIENVTETWINSRNNQKLKTFIYNQREKKALIVVCHGFSGSSSGAFYPTLCEELAKNYMVVRFDFRGQGESEGSFYDSCLTNEFEDLDCVVNFMKENYQPNKTVVVGHSFGAAVALLFASLHQNEIAAYISISGEGDLGKAEEIEFSKQQLEELKLKGETMVVNWSKNGAEELIGKRHLNDLKLYSTISAVRGMIIPTLFVHGDEDNVIPIERSREMSIMPITPSKMIILKGADHTYNYETGSSRILELAEILKNWLKENLPVR